jgi:hypothetical protein
MLIEIVCLACSFVPAHGDVGSKTYCEFKVTTDVILEGMTQYRHETVNGDKYRTSFSTIEYIIPFVADGKPAMHELFFRDKNTGEILAYGICEPFGPYATIFSDGFEGGNAGAWK